MAPRPRQLSLEIVLDGAIEVAREKGFDALTMRDVARQLDVTPMAPYHYVKGKDELVTLLVDRALDSVEIPAADEGTWEEQFRTYAQRIHAVFREYGRALAVNLQLAVTPASRRLMQAGRRILATSGLPEAEVDRAYGMWHMHTLGRLVFQAGTWQGDHSRRGPRAKRTHDPALPPEAMRFADREYLDYALELFIAGVRSRVRELPS